MINNIPKGNFLTTNSNGSYSFQTIKQSRCNEVPVTPCKVPVKPYNRSYRCEICNSTFYSERGVINHRSSPLHKNNIEKKLAEECIITAVIPLQIQHITKINSKANLPQHKQKRPKRSTTLCKAPSLIKCTNPKIPVIEIIDENDKLIAAYSAKNKLVDLSAVMQPNLQGGLVAPDIVDEMFEENNKLAAKTDTASTTIDQLVKDSINDFQLDMLPEA
jgi:hypothetical protein